MKIETFWKTIIKLFGIWFLIGGLSTTLQSIQVFSYINGDLNIEAVIYTTLWIIGSIVIYSIIIRLFLFKTDWIIKNLKLSQNYSEDKIDINIKSSSVITISIIIIGGMTVVDSVPNLLSEILKFLQQKILLKDYPKFNWIIFELLKCILGYLLVTKSKMITKYIENESNIN